jgi:type I restriction enzyme S subunit
VVENCAVTCDPAEAGLERFVAMEHLEPGSLHVRSWGNVADGTTFTRRCRPGQVLFGKRRAYQRKVAVAEFEAVVSGDIYVLAPKDTQRLLPELLPFLCLSERFFQHAVGTSAGSLSPRTNWSSLASFEFDLPPLDQQRRIAEILWAVDEVKSSHEKLHHELQIIHESMLDEEFSNETNAKKLADVLAYASDGPFGSKLKTEHYAASGARVIRLQNIGDGAFDSSDEACIADEYFDQLKRYEVRANDVIVAGLGDETHPVGRAALVPESLGRAVNKADCFCLRAKPSLIENAYLVYFLNSRCGNKQVQSKAQGTTRLRINVGNLKTISIPVPPLPDQSRFVGRVRGVEETTANVDAALRNDASLIEAFLNQITSSS